LRLFSFGGYGLALPALALVLFGAYDSYPFPSPHPSFKVSRIYERSLKTRYVLVKNGGKTATRLENPIFRNVFYENRLFASHVTLVISGGERRGARKPKKLRRRARGAGKFHPVLLALADVNLL